MENKKVKMVCSQCGSGDVKKDAYAVWDAVTQQWEACAVFDKGDVCESCCGETTIKEVAYDPEDVNYTVFGSHGEITIDKIGYVIEISHDLQADSGEEREYIGIERFDVIEYEMFLKSKGFEMPEHGIDILDISYWQNGEFVKFEQSHRDEIILAWKESRKS